jgi:hypothetical protein
MRVEEALTGLINDVSTKQSSQTSDGETTIPRGKRFASLLEKTFGVATNLKLLAQQNAEPSELLGDEFKNLKTNPQFRSDLASLFANQRRSNR